MLGCHFSQNMSAYVRLSTKADDSIGGKDRLFEDNMTKIS